MYRTRLLALAIITLACGCSSGSRIFQVHGTVLYDGRPLPKGMIFFDPEPGNASPQGHAVIIDGAYATTGAMGQGMFAGNYLVRIDGFDGKPGRELPLGRPVFTNYSEHRVIDPKSLEQNFDIARR